MSTIETKIESYTNFKLKNWYINAKLDYNVIGFATTKIEGNKITINYTEDGVEKTWSMAYYPEYINGGLDYFYNVWAEVTR